MTQVSLPIGASHSGANLWADVYNNDAAITTVVNGDIRNDNISASAAITDAKLASSNNGTFKRVAMAHAPLGSAAVAGTYLLGGAGNLASGTAQAWATSVRVPTVFQFQATDYQVAAKTTYLRVRASVATNATAPGITFTFGLYPASSAGAADTLSIAAGTVISGSTSAIATPGGSLITSAVGSNFAAPSDGLYLLAVVTSGSIAANSMVACYGELQAVCT